MGCGASKIQQEETAQTCQITHGRNDDVVDLFKEDAETEAPRKSVSSMASESGFLKRVIGSNNEKERGVERELEPSNGDNGGRRSLSSCYSPFKDYSLCFKQPQSLETLDNDIEIDNKKMNNDKNNKIEVEKDKFKNDTEDEFSRPSDVEDLSSIIFGPGSPSFRVYCVDNYTYEEEDEGVEETEETTSGKEGDKEIEGEVEKRGRRRRRGIRRAMYKGGSALGLRSVLVQVQRRGSVKMRNILPRSPKSAPSSDVSTKYLIPKPAG